MSGPFPPMATPAPNNPLSELILALRDVMAKQPPWVHVAVAIAAMLFGAAGNHVCRAPSVVTVPIPVTVPTPAPFPVLVPTRTEYNPTAAPTENGHPVVSLIVRRHLAEQMMKDGYATAGGDKTPFEAKAAHEQISKLTNATIIEGGKTVGMYGATGDGQIRDGMIISFMRNVLQWIKDHPEQMAALIKLLLSLLMFL